jgi:CheY-like chemotaxis protein
MVKILIAKNIHILLQKESSFLDRTGVTVFPAASNDELLQIHRRERVDLIITELDMPGKSSEDLFSLIREDKELRFVPVIMVCENTPAQIEKCARCGVSDVLPRPVDQARLLERTQQFLALFAREAARVPLNTEVYAAHGNQLVKCRSRDIGVSGMLIETEGELKRGDRLVLSFALPDSERVRVEAEIVSSPANPSGTRSSWYGLRCTGLTRDAKQSLQAFVDRRSRAAA